MSPSDISPVTALPEAAFANAIKPLNTALHPFAEWFPSNGKRLDTSCSSFLSSIRGISTGMGGAGGGQQDRDLLLHLKQKSLESHFNIFFYLRHFKGDFFPPEAAAENCTISQRKKTLPPPPKQSVYNTRAGKTGTLRASQQQQHRWDR